jgi:hypothetical protein
MPYARLDDRWDDHRKIKRAWRRQPAAVALHAMTITYCNRHNTSGEVDAEWIEEKLALLPLKPAQRRAVLATLLDLELLERKDADTYVVHDFCDWNLSREQRAALADQGRRGGRARHGSSGPDSNGPGPGSSQGLGEGSSHPEPTGSSTPRHATPTPSQVPAAQVARKRVARQIDQAQAPEGFPTELLSIVDAVLAILRRIWEARGGIEPMVRGVALSILRNPKADHTSVALKLEQWLTAGNGRRAPCKDICARFGDWVETEGAAQRPGADILPMRRENASDLLKALDGGAT